MHALLALLDYQPVQFLHGKSTLSCSCSAKGNNKKRYVLVRCAELGVVVYMYSVHGAQQAGR